MLKRTVYIFLLFLPVQLFSGSVVGTVSNAQSGKPVLDVKVTIIESSRETTTDSAGTYYFDTLAPGTYTLGFQKDGFESHMRNDVYLAGAGTKRVDVVLVPQILTLDKMVVRCNAFHRSPDMSSSTKIVNADELLRAPGALVDVQRVVQNLPSVTSGGDNINEVVVRGGTPGENLLIMDHIEIPNANHFADQHSGGGVISLINPLLVKGLTFNAGAPPAQYGGKASSVIDVMLREGNDAIVLGGVDLGMAGAGGHIEGPLWKGSNFMVSGHKSYLDFVARFDPSIAIPEFWGLQGKMSQKIKAHKLSLNGIYGKNYIKIMDLKKDGFDYDTIQSGGIVYAGGLSWKTYWRDMFSTLVVASSAGNTFDRLAYSPPYTIKDTINDSIYALSYPADTSFTGGTWNDEQTLRVEALLDFANQNKMILGAYGKRFEFLIDQQDKPDTVKDYSLDPTNGIPDTTITGEPVIYGEQAHAHDTAYKYGGYLSFTFHAFNRLRLVPGIRFDRLVYNKSFSVSPRLNAVLSVNEYVDVTAAFGIQYQDPEFIDFTIDPGNAMLKPKRAITGIVGGEYYLDLLGVKIVTEGFYKRYDNLLFDSSLLSLDSLHETDRLVDDGVGHSFGFELFAQKKLTASFFWNAAFQLSKSLYKDLRSNHRYEWYDGDYDFRHSFTVTGGWKKDMLKSPRYKKKFHDKLWFKILHPIMLPLADRMEISAKWRYLDGKPYTEKKFSPTYKRWYIDVNDPLNNKRYDPYHRLDLRHERRYGFGFLQLIYYIDIQNLYNRKNIWTYLYPEKNGKRYKMDQIPFFPAGGIIIGF